MVGLGGPEIILLVIIGLILAGGPVVALIFALVLGRRQTSGEVAQLRAEVQRLRNEIERLKRTQNSPESGQFSESR